MEDAVATAKDPRRRWWEDYVHGLEEERRKIELFRRELPLCLDLVSQTIESYKRRMEGEAAPVLEEFMPIAGAPPAEEKKNVTEGEADREEDDGRGKLDWLRSVQLWSQNHEPCQQGKKASIVIDGRVGSGAFRPFARVAAEVPRPLPPEEEDGKATAAVAESSTAETVAGEGCGSSGQASAGEKKKVQSRRKTRRCWSPELHRRFVDVLQQLGGAQSATPKQIREAMKVSGLTCDEVKSHLQKYRLHERRPINGAIPCTSGSPEAPQFILVGGIWVPPPQYDGSLAKVVCSPVTLSASPVPKLNQKQQTFRTVLLQQAPGRKGSSSSSRSSSSTSPHS